MTESVNWLGQKYLFISLKEDTAYSYCVYKQNHFILKVFFIFDNFIYKCNENMIVSALYF